MLFSRECCDFIDLVLRLWPTYNLEKHIALLQDAIKKGISDADPDARQFSRKYVQNKILFIYVFT